MASPAPVTPEFTPRRRSLFGPIMLISVGVVFLLVNMGTLSMRNVFEWFSKYWPALLIVWGVSKLIEHLRARREGYAAPGIGVGGVFTLVFIIMFGTAISGAFRYGPNIGNLRDHMRIDGEDFGGIFGKKFEFTENIDQAFPAGGALKVVLERGNVKVTPSSDDKFHMTMRKTIYADSQAEADKINPSLMPKLTVTDNVLSVDATGSAWQNPRLNLEIMIPKKASVDLMTMRGEVEVQGREGAIRAHASNGNVTLMDVVGNADVHMRSGDFTATKITGDVNLEGRLSDTNVNDVTGIVALNGDFFGDIQIARVGKSVRFKSSRTEMEMAKLGGDLTMGSGELRITTVSGPFRILSKNSRDVTLESVSGDVRIENRNGEVEVHPEAKGLGNIDITNRNGSIRLMVPAAASFQVDARTRRGEIESDFDLVTTSADRENKATGTVNKGGPKFVLNNENGSITIRKQ